MEDYYPQNVVLSYLPRQYHVRQHIRNLLQSYGPNDCIVIDDECCELEEIFAREWDRCEEMEQTIDKIILFGHGIEAGSALEHLIFTAYTNHKEISFYSPKMRNLYEEMASHDISAIVYYTFNPGKEPIVEWSPNVYILERAELGQYDVQALHRMDHEN